LKYLIRFKYCKEQGISSVDQLFETMEEDFDLQTYITDYIKKEDIEKKFDLIPLDRKFIEEFTITKNKDNEFKYNINFLYKDPIRQEVYKSTINICNNTNCTICTKTVTDKSLYTFFRVNYRIEKCAYCTNSNYKIKKHIGLPNIKLFPNYYSCECEKYDNVVLRILIVHKYLNCVNNNNLDFCKEQTWGELIDKITEYYDFNYASRFHNFANKMLVEFIEKLKNKQYNNTKITEFLKTKTCIESQYVYYLMDMKLVEIFEMIYWKYRYCAFIIKNMTEMDEWNQFMSSNINIKYKYYKYISKKILDAHDFNLTSFLANFTLKNARMIFDYIIVESIPDIKITDNNPYTKYSIGDQKWNNAQNLYNEHSIIGAAISTQKWDIVKILYNDIVDRKISSLTYGNIAVGIVDLVDNIFKAKQSLLSKDQLTDDNLIYNILSRDISDKLVKHIELCFELIINKINEIMGKEVVIGLFSYLLFSIISHKCEDNYSVVLSGSSNAGKHYDTMTKQIIKYAKEYFMKQDFNYVKTENKDFTEYELCVLSSCITVKDYYLYHLIIKFAKLFCKNNVISSDNNLVYRFMSLYFTKNEEYMNTRIYILCLDTLFNH
jgi:hypothetical protein